MKYNSVYKWQLVSVPQSIALSKEGCEKGVERQGSNEISSMHLSSECVPQCNPPQPSRHSSHITLVPTLIPIINGLCFSCYIQLHIISNSNLQKNHASLILSFLSNTEISFSRTLTPGDSSIRLFLYS
jgi:hypothetical protein